MYLNVLMALLSVKMTVSDAWLQNSTCNCDSRDIWNFMLKSEEGKQHFWSNFFVLYTCKTVSFYSAKSKKKLFF